jgi:clan AA aspartic protease
MGLVYADITLKNASDVVNSDKGIINEQEIHQTTVKALVDTGAITLVINEKVRKALGLALKGKNRHRLADGTSHEFQYTEAVDIHWKNRDTTCRAILVPDAGNVLLGAIPLEGMDLIVDPKHLELVGAHGDEVVHLLC